MVVIFKAWLGRFIQHPSFLFIIRVRCLGLLLSSRRADLKATALREGLFKTAISKRFSCLINVLQVATITRLIGNYFEVVLEYFHFQTLKFQCSICNFTEKRTEMTDKPDYMWWVCWHRSMWISLLLRRNNELAYYYWHIFVTIKRAGIIIV